MCYKYALYTSSRIMLHLPNRCMDTSAGVPSLSSDDTALKRSGVFQASEKSVNIEL
jgi:hypothetical protein